MKRITALSLTVLLVALLFVSTIPTSAASINDTAPLAVNKDTAELAEYWEPYYDEPLDIFYTDYGNVDMDAKVTVRDATLIQKAIAELVTLSDYALTLADVTGDYYVAVTDATAIQKYVAGIIDYFPVFTKNTIPEDEKGTTFECSASGYAQIEFTIKEDGYYSIRFFRGAADDTVAILCDENGYYITSAITPEYDDPSMRLPLASGTYKVIAYTSDDNRLYPSGSIFISKIEDDFYFGTNKDDAVELLTFESDTVPADSPARLYKIYNDKDIDDTLVFHITCESPVVYGIIYSDNMEVLGTVNETLSEELCINLDTLSLPKNEYFYIYVYIPVGPGQEGLDFTAHLTTHTRYVLEECPDIEYNTPVSVKKPNDTATDGYTDIGYKFTPAYDGYYKFQVEMTIDSSLETTVSLAVCDERVLNSDENSLLGIKNMSLKRIDSDYVTAYLKGEQTYYLYGSAVCDNFLDYLVITATSCTEEEHLQSGSEVPQPIEIEEAEELFVGDTKTLNISAEDGEILYKFTATSDEALVFYSEGDGDPMIYIYDAYGNSLVYEDDIHYYEGKLNFALYGEVDAGETYYIGIACHDEAKKDITFSLVRNTEYTPE